MSSDAGPDLYAEIADLYDHVPLYRTRPDLQFYLDAAREAGSPVLEVGCGTGRVLLPVARAGVGIVGLDISPAMLAQCRRHLAAEPASVQGRVELVEGDMRRFDLGRLFTLVTLPFRPFQHLVTVADQLAALASFGRHLKPGGILILDLFNPSLELLASRPIGQEVPEGDEVTTSDGRRLARSFRIVAADRFAQVNQVELIYHVTHPDGRAERLLQAFPMRYLFRFEAEHLLVRAGFEILHLYGGYDKRPYGSEYPGELIFVARKRPAP